MARFFKYKSLPEIEADATRLGLDLRFQSDFSPLFTPQKVGTRTVGNRWCIHPMEGCDGNLDGTPGELTFRRYKRFGDGGAKIIWGEACAVTEESRANPRQIWLNDATKSEFARLVSECKAAHQAAGYDDSDLLFGIQLTHSGRYSYRRPVIAAHDPLLDRRTVVNKATRETVNSAYPLITDDELKRLVEDYVRTAKLAAEVGFDFVDVKQCHRYLLSELLGATNRPGPYGGSFENRTRLAREIFQAIAAAVPGMLLTTRMNGFDGIPYHMAEDTNGAPDDWQKNGRIGWGLNVNDPTQPDPTEPIRWVQEMGKLGVSLVNIALGNPYAQPHFGRPFETPPPDGYESPEHPLIGVNRHFAIAGAIQAANPDLPIVGTGYSYLQEFLPHAGAANVATGRISFVGVGRASLSQPDWVRQLATQGTLDRKRICRTFSYCTAIMRAKDHPLGQYPTGCPPFDKEAYGEIWKEVQQLGVKK
ncbi:MAG: NADH:flavin oxidoreductase [Fimbriiglobus sp.]